MRPYCGWPAIRSRAVSGGSSYALCASEDTILRRCAA